MVPKGRPCPIFREYFSIFCPPRPTHPLFESLVLTPNFSAAKKTNKFLGISFMCGWSAGKTLGGKSRKSVQQQFSYLNGQQKSCPFWSVFDIRKSMWFNWIQDGDIVDVGNDDDVDDDYDDDEADDDDDEKDDLIVTLAWWNMWTCGTWRHCILLLLSVTQHWH